MSSPDPKDFVLPSGPPSAEAPPVTLPMGPAVPIAPVPDEPVSAPILPTRAPTSIPVAPPVEIPVSAPPTRTSAAEQRMAPVAPPTANESAS